MWFYSALGTLGFSLKFSSLLFVCLLVAILTRDDFTHYKLWCFFIHVHVNTVCILLFVLHSGCVLLSWFFFVPRRWYNSTLSRGFLYLYMFLYTFYIFLVQRPKQKIQRNIFFFICRSIFPCCCHSSSFILQPLLPFTSALTAVHTGITNYTNWGKILYSSQREGACSRLWTEQQKTGGE